MLIKSLLKSVLIKCVPIKVRHERPLNRCLLHVVRVVLYREIGITTCGMEATSRGSAISMLVHRLACHGLRLTVHWAAATSAKEGSSGRGPRQVRVPAKVTLWVSGLSLVGAWCLPALGWQAL